MTSFEEYQTRATQLPASLRNNRDRINLPILGLQEEAGKTGLLLANAAATGKIALTTQQSADLRNRLSHILWYVALLSGEAGTKMQDLASHGLAQLEARSRDLDPDRR